MNTRYYIAGPMRGIPLYNFPAFDSAAEKLRSQGYEVISPADVDRRRGFDPALLPSPQNWTVVPDVLCLEEVVNEDLNLLETCDGIYMLPGWEFSTGATAEHAVAKWRGLDIKYAFKPVALDIGVPCTPVIQTRVICLGARTRMTICGGYTSFGGTPRTVYGLICDDTADYWSIKLPESNRLLAVNKRYVETTERVVLWKQVHEHKNDTCVNPLIRYYACNAGIDLTCTNESPFRLAQGIMDIAATYRSTGTPVFITAVDAEYV